MLRILGALYRGVVHTKPKYPSQAGKKDEMPKTKTVFSWFFLVQRALAAEQRLQQQKATAASGWWAVRSVKVIHVQEY